MLNIPYSRHYAELYSIGELVAAQVPKFSNQLVDLYDSIQRHLKEGLSPKATAPKQAVFLSEQPTHTAEPIVAAQDKPIELAVISGKGGTGKTSLAASLGYLAQNVVLADCDVDGANLHLLVSPSKTTAHTFSGGDKARLDSQICTGCSLCLEHCRFQAISGTDTEPSTITINSVACEGCGICAYFCPEQAIKLSPTDGGTWMVSKTPYGPFVHAKLGIAQENSGRLVSLVRGEARKQAHQNNSDLIVIDGAPGIGCPVIATATGADLVLIVTEPTISGIHDLERVLKLTAHFKQKTAVCTNKSDMNPQLTEQVQKIAIEKGAEYLGSIQYDSQMIQSQIEGRPIVAYSESQAGQQIRHIWDKLSALLASIHARRKELTDHD